MIKDVSSLHDAMSTITNAWRSGQPEKMRELLHPEIIMKLPGFSGTISGREALLDGFKEFCTNAKVLEYTERDEQVDIAGNTAIVTIGFEMVYEREKYRDKSSGRDFWIFEWQNDKWIAVWRTMVDLEETRLLEK